MRKCDRCPLNQIDNPSSDIQYVPGEIRTMGGKGLLDEDGNLRIRLETLVEIMISRHNVLANEVPYALECAKNRENDICTEST